MVDTNVALSALVLAHSRLAPLRLAWQDRRCLPLASRATAVELIRALTCPKFNLSIDEQRELLADYLPYCTSVRLPAKLPKVRKCRDPDDLPFLQLAVVGKADYLVTGDQDLLALSGQFICPIIAPGRLLAVIGKD
ncbi:MAG: putative toxin-antitoxin system toxin component, PIN family [Burkholderiales bacterium]